MVKPQRRFSERGAVMPLFAMTSVVMLLIIFLIFDIGKLRITQSEAYIAADAGALAGADQSTYYEQVDYKEKTTRVAIYRSQPVYHYLCVNEGKDCRRVPPYSEPIFDHWKYTTQPPETKVVKSWVEIDEDKAKEAAKSLFWDNANQSTLTANGREVKSVDPHLTDIDKMSIWTDVQVKNLYFPSFVKGLFNANDVPTSTTIRKESDSQAVKK